MFEKSAPKNLHLLQNAPLSDPPTVGEIQERVKRRYVDRLSQRVKRIRRLLLDREWPELRNEARQLREGGSEFGFIHLSELASAAEKLIPETGLSRLRPMPEARQAVENLICAIDVILVEASARTN
jgi:hypothetical protein